MEKKEEILKKIGCKELSSIFEEHSFDWATAQLLSPEELKELRKIGPRVRFKNYLDIQKQKANDDIQFIDNNTHEDLHHREQSLPTDLSPETSPTPETSSTPEPTEPAKIKENNKKRALHSDDPETCTNAVILLVPYIINASPARKQKNRPDPGMEAVAIRSCQ